MITPIRDLEIQRKLILDGLKALYLYKELYAQQHHHNSILDVTDYLHGEQEIVDKAIAKLKETAL